jgi:hypothetical protein
VFITENGPILFTWSNRTKATAQFKATTFITRSLKEGRNRREHTGTGTDEYAVTIGHKSKNNSGARGKMHNKTSLVLIQQR